MVFYNDYFPLLTVFLTSYQQEGSNYEKGFINSFIRCNHWATGIFMTLNILMIHVNCKYTGVG